MSKKTSSTPHAAAALESIILRDFGSTRELAEQSGFDSPNFSRIRSGAQSVTITALAAIMPALSKAAAGELLAAVALDVLTDEQASGIIGDDGAKNILTTQKITTRLDIAIEALRAAALTDHDLRTWIIDTADLFNLLPEADALRVAEDPGDYSTGTGGQGENEPQSTDKQP